MHGVVCVVRLVTDRHMLQNVSTCLSIACVNPLYAVETSRLSSHPSPEQQTARWAGTEVKRQSGTWMGESVFPDVYGDNVVDTFSLLLRRQSTTPSMTAPACRPCSSSCFSCTVAHCCPTATHTHTRTLLMCNRISNLLHGSTFDFHF